MQFEVKGCFGLLLLKGLWSFLVCVCICQVSVAKVTADEYWMLFTDWVSLIWFFEKTYIDDCIVVLDDERWKLLRCQKNTK